MSNPILELIVVVHLPYRIRNFSEPFAIRFLFIISDSDLTLRRVSQSQTSTHEHARQDSSKRDNTSSPVYYLLESSNEENSAKIQDQSFPAVPLGGLARRNTPKPKRLSRVAFDNSQSEENLKPSGTSTEEAPTVHSDIKGDHAYDVPKSTSKYVGKEDTFQENSEVCGKLKVEDEDIYEITFKDDQIPASVTDAVAAEPSSVESSGTYQELGQIQSASGKQNIYELAKPMGTKSPENLLESSLRSSGHFVSCKQGTPRNSGDMPQMPSPEEIEHEYTRLKYSRSRKKRVSAEHKGYNSLHNVSEEQKGQFLFLRHCAHVLMRRLLNFKLKC